MATTIKFKRGTAAAWTSANPTLAAGEPGFETDTGKFKIGDGTTAWNSLAYAGGGDDHFLGLYTSLVNLEAAHPTAVAGDYANVDPGEGTDVVRYIWDEDEGWVQGGGGGAGTWGSITGTLSDQTDLQSALDALALTIESASVAGSTITFDFAGKTSGVFVGSASFSTAKTLADDNDSNAVVSSFLFEITDLAAVLTCPSEWISDHPWWDSGNKQWVPESVGKFELSRIYDGANWRVKFVGPQQ